MMMCFQIGYYFYRRVAENERPATMGVFFDGLSDCLLTSRAHIDTLFADLIELSLAQTRQAVG